MGCYDCKSNNPNPHLDTDGIIKGHRYYIIFEPKDNNIKHQMWEIIESKRERLNQVQ